MLVALRLARLGRDLRVVHSKHLLPELALVLGLIGSPRSCCLRVEAQRVAAGDVILGVAQARAQEARQHGSQLVHTKDREGLCFRSGIC